eukprot:gb/GECG01012210.1/.p1 GENE.gb/GECG01012210.1/~~gb/GECG01012210.1/.p1  ORF type:complete len:906 (+),score=151.74 gb/GECG01012210.1/:1-2718(+)
MGDKSPSVSEDDYYSDGTVDGFEDDEDNDEEQQQEQEDLNNLRVMARIRPPAGEDEQGADDCLHISEDQSSITVRSMKAAPKDWKEQGQALTQEFKCESYPDATQREFSRAARLDKYLNLAFDGYNSAVLAYGQTGSGKTYTIFGSTPGLADPKYRGRIKRRRASMTMQEHGPANTLSDFGLAPLAAKRLFEILDMKTAMQLGEEAGVVVDKSKRKNDPSKEAYDYKVSISMVEIYNEQLHDLLTGLQSNDDSVKGASGKKSQRRSSISENMPKDRLNKKPSKGPDLAIRYNSLRGDYYVKGAECVEVGDAQEAVGVVEHGLTNRVYAQHNLNERSSRGHCLLTFYIDAVPQHQPKGLGTKNTEAARYGKLLFADLAGSENLRASGSKGHRAKETAAINKSLFALGKLVDAVAKEQKKIDAYKRGSVAGQLPSVKGSSPPKQQQTSTPYRDSKLTMLLRDCLGGNSCTLMVACISPSDEHGPESLRTLRFMARASEVKNAAKAHVSPKDELIEQLRSQIRKLKKENEALRQKTSRASVADKDSQSEGSRVSRQRIPKQPSKGGSKAPSFESSRSVQGTNDSFHSAGSVPPLGSSTTPEKQRQSPRQTNASTRENGESVGRSPRSGSDSVQYQTPSQLRETARQEAESGDGTSLDNPGMELPEMMNGPRKKEERGKSPRDAGIARNSKDVVRPQGESPAEFQSPRQPNQKPPRTEKKPVHSGRRLKAIEKTNTSNFRSPRAATGNASPSSGEVGELTGTPDTQGKSQSLRPDDYPRRQLNGEGADGMTDTPGIDGAVPASGGYSSEMSHSHVANGLNNTGDGTPEDFNIGHTSRANAGGTFDTGGDHNVATQNGTEMSPGLDEQHNSEDHVRQVDDIDDSVLDRLEQQINSGPSFLDNDFENEESH